MLRALREHRWVVGLLLLLLGAAAPARAATPPGCAHKNPNASGPIQELAALRLELSEAPGLRLLPIAPDAPLDAAAAIPGAGCSAVVVDSIDLPSFSYSTDRALTRAVSAPRKVPPAALFRPPRVS